MFVDSHAHLSFKDYKDDLDAVIERAWNADLKFIINIGAGQGVDGNDLAIGVAEKYDKIYVAIGVHPHDAKDFSQETISFLKNKAKHPKVVGIGEIGLDYHYKHSPPGTQKIAFVGQLELAKELGFPVAIHDREAHEDCYKIIKDVGHYKGVMHCFSGDVPFAKKVLDLGFYISIPGIVTFDKANILKDVVKEIPLEKIFIETDCPFLAPVPYRGKRNEPAYVVETARMIAKIKDKDIDEVGRITTKNVEDLFGIR